MPRTGFFALFIAFGLLACNGRARVSPGPSGEAHDQPRSGPAIAVLNLSGGVPEQSPVGLLGLSTNTASFDEFVHEIERVGRDKGVRGVLVRLGGVRMGLARATEIGALLEGLG